MRLLGWLGLFAVLSLALAEQRSEVQAEDGLLRRNKLSREDIQRLRGKLHSLVAEMSDLKTEFHTPAEQSEVMRMAAKTPAVALDSALSEVTSKKEPVPAAALETSDAAEASVQDDVTMPDDFFKESKAALARLKANVIAEARAQRMEEQLGDRFSRAAAAIVARQDAESPAQEDLAFAEASNGAASTDKSAAKGKSGSSVDAKAKARELAMAGGTPSLSALSIDDIDLDAANDLQDEKKAAGDTSAEVAAHAALIQGRAALEEAKAAKADEESSLSPDAKKKINQMKAKLLKHKPTLKVDPKKIQQLKNNKMKLAATNERLAVVNAAGVAAQGPPQLLDTSDKVRASSTGVDDAAEEPDPRAKDILNPDIKPETKKEDEFGDSDDDKSAANALDEKPKTQEEQDADEKPIIEPKPDKSAATSLSQDECIKKCKHGTCKDGICNCEGAWTGSDCNTPPPAGADKTQSSTAGSSQQSNDADTKPTAAQPATQAAAANTVTAQASGAGVVFDTPVTTIPRGALKLTTVLALDFETIATSGKDKDTFVNQFAADLAKAMGISQQRIQVMGVKAGSVIVSFAITASDTDTRTVGDLATQFQEMAQDPGSPLHKGIVSAHIDPSMAVRVEAGEGAVWSSASRFASPTLLSLLACVLATFLALALSS